ncbi:MAG: diacylglycerol kinase family lipid kinase [Chloroflexi bacterium]|nr:diacylglycerol kinase family lipid kinase [Chloroflexota bacterium]
MPRFCIIYNPTSNKGNAGKILPLVRQELDRYGMDYELITTQYIGHALELAKQAAVDGFDAVVAAGGDGTANEVINGLMFDRKAGSHTPALGVLPIGRGNDFNYSVGGPKNWQESCRILSRAATRWIDIGCIKGGLYPEGRYFGNGIGIGFDAVVSFIAARQRITGFAGYLVAALKTMYVYSPAPVVSVEIENETITQPSLMINVMNGRRLGGGFMIAPNGDAHDGVMDICLTKGVGKFKTLCLITKFLQGTQYTQPEIIGRRVSKVTVRAVKGTLPIHADGETIAIECDQVEIELLPAQLKMYLSKAGAE